MDWPRQSKISSCTPIAANHRMSPAASTSSPIVEIGARPGTAWETVEEVVAREPDLIIGSWCGKKFRPERVAAGPGFDRTPAVQH
jgi:hypothetical protein